MDEAVTAEMVEAIAPRFWAKVDKRGADECWPWIGFTHKGYGRFKVEGFGARAHRVSLLIDGRDPGKLCACHTCDNPTCVNPAHLFVGSQAQNVADRDAKARRAPPQGASNPNAKLTEADIRAIRVDDRLLTVIGAEYGVAFSVISGIRTRRTWKHVV